jgi:phosphoribosylformimino-5-aminoimidazole carboxamide ribotide isomerase
MTFMTRLALDACDTVHHTAFPSSGCGQVMEIIPVIDLKGGRVVRARMGQRDRYRPIETPLSSTSDPVDVTCGLLSVFPFRTLYVADLDAIAQIGDSGAILGRLKTAFPQLDLWIDNGCAEASAARIWLDGGSTLVLGSETQRDASLVQALKNDPRVVLSLDFRGDAFIGPTSLLATPDIWPRRVLVMTLARIGSDVGPDVQKLRSIQRVAGNRLLFAAGGVRNADDLKILKEDGVAGALVASSLHDGRLTAEDLSDL